jgi:hypothetical protein
MGMIWLRFRAIYRLGLKPRIIISTYGILQPFIPLEEFILSRQYLTGKSHHSGACPCNVRMRADGRQNGHRDFNRLSLNSPMTMCPQTKRLSGQLQKQPITLSTPALGWR